MAAELNALTRPPGTATAGSVAVAVPGREYRTIEYLPSTGWLLSRAPRPAQPLPVTLRARAYSLIPGPDASPHSIPLLGPGPGFDRDYAMTTDLTRPLIIATVPVPGGPPAALLIDSYARPDTVR